MNLKLSPWKIVFAASITICLVLSTYALSTFTRSYTWNMTGKSYKVQATLGGAELLSTAPTINLTDVDVNSTFGYEFYVTNTGFEPITITVQQTAVNVTATWNDTEELIAVGATYLFNVTLSNFAGAGSYSFSFVMS